MRSNMQHYFQSLSAELDVQADRVRALIGEAHWLSDGGHKEALLRGLVEKHMPSGTIVTRGFLVGPLSPENCSREQDLLVLDCSSDPPLFNYGGLVVTSPDHAYGCLSVKSTFGKDQLLDSLDGFLSIPKCASGATPFFGSYHYAPDGEMPLPELGEKLSRWLGPHDARVSMVVRVSPSVFFILETDQKPHRIRLYAAANASTAFFVARLVSHVTSLRSKRPSAFADALDAAVPCSAFLEVSLPCD
ncbi:MAG: hypothetical protein IT373_24935 [Polyangiaceae bacterium]|nr:hypothetical protein [Polyangiaceae bacterium]